MQVRDLKLPAPIFCAAAGIDPTILRKWISGNSVSVKLLVDADRATDNGPNEYTFADLVRVLLVMRLRDGFGISTTPAIQVCNAAFDDLQDGVNLAWKEIDRDGYSWGDKEDQPLNGPFLAVHRNSKKFATSLITAAKGLSLAGANGDLFCAVVCDLRQFVQLASTNLSASNVAKQVAALLEGQGAAEKA